MLRVAAHASRSDTGRQRRGNEDAFYARTPLFVVADGMGGAQAGEVASRIAVESFERGLDEADGQPAERRIAARVEEANQAIHSLSRTDAERAGMGTTITVAYVGSDDVTIAHVGDSRAYLLRDGQLARLTEDHSLVEELKRQGKLSEEEAGEHPQRSIITRALGPEPEVRVDTQTLSARDGDVLMLCSDGLTSMVDEATIRRVLTASDDLDAVAQRLVKAANDAGGRDNITVVLLRIEDVGGGRRQGTDELDQPTEIRPPAPRDETAAHDPVPAAAEAPEAPEAPAARGAVATAAPPAASTAPRRPRERMRAPSERRRRRFPTWLKALIVAVVILVPVVVGLWVASQTVYFIGTDAQGRVTLFRGLPYELPAGIDLYSENFVSGVPAIELPPNRRGAILDHQLRSHDDAVREMQRIELGQVER